MPFEEDDSSPELPEEVKVVAVVPLECDYLVVGAGNAGMSFVDTILTLNPSVTVILVDRFSMPGGHWTKAYPFVRLHQPGCYYGVNSRRLGKNLNGKGNEIYDLDDRPSGREIVEYYQKVHMDFAASGRVTSFFGAEYEFDEETSTHTILASTSSNTTSTSATNNTTSSITNGRRAIPVNCGKVVTVTSGVTVPSMREPLIPVHESVRPNFVPPNDVSQSVESGRYTNYVVFGNGKTGVDTITTLLRDQGIDPSKITWVVPRDVWYMRRESLAKIYEYVHRLHNIIVNASSSKEVFLTCEAHGMYVRLDPNRPCPEVFKAAIVDMGDLAAMRSIQTIVRRGRATSIGADRILFQDGSLEFSPRDTLLVDCMVNISDGIYGYSFGDDFRIFEPGRINLGPNIAVYNPSFSSAVIAFLECKQLSGSGAGAKDDDDDDDDDDDEINAKNTYCYFLRGNQHGGSSLEQFIGHIYMQTKSFQALANVEGFKKFRTQSRTTSFAPLHHKRGMLHLLWLMYGPKQMHKMGKKLVQKIESKGYSDFDHCFGMESFPGEK